MNNDLLTKEELMFWVWDEEEDPIDENPLPYKGCNVCWRWLPTNQVLKSKDSCKDCERKRNKEYGSSPAGRAKRNEAKARYWANGHQNPETKRQKSRRKGVPKVEN